jgi:hypothetical protein
MLKNCFQTSLLAYKLKDISYKSIWCSCQTDQHIEDEVEVVNLSDP